VTVRIELDGRQGFALSAGEWIELDNTLQLVTKEGQLPGPVFIVGWEDIDNVALHPERAALEGGVIAIVLQLNQKLGDFTRVNALANLQLAGH